MPRRRRSGSTRRRRRCRRCSAGSGGPRPASGVRLRGRQRGEPRARRRRSAASATRRRRRRTRRLAPSTVGDELLEPGAVVVVDEVAVELVRGGDEEPIALDRDRHAAARTSGGRGPRASARAGRCRAGPSGPPPLLRPSRLRGLPCVPSPGRRKRFPRRRELAGRIHYQLFQFPAPAPVWRPLRLRRRYLTLLGERDQDPPSWRAKGRRFRGARPRGPWQRTGRGAARPRDP